MKTIIFTLFVAMLTSPINLLADTTISESAADVDIYFIQPSDGQTVKNNVKVVFGLKNMGIAPAGVEKKNTGHHHLLIDTDVMPDLTKPLPANDKIKHFGGGQTETVVTLSPGKHTLQLLLLLLLLLLGNYAHIPHNKPVMSEKITIMVE